MNTGSFIAGRLKFGSGISVAATALSFCLIIVAVSISEGFKQGISDSLSALGGDIQICSEIGAELSGGNPVDLDEAWVGEVEALEGVEKLTPAVYRSSIVKNGDDIHGVIFKGVEFSDTLGGVTVPGRLAEMLRLEVGDELLSYFISDKVQVRKFKIRALYEPLSDASDKMVVLAPIADMRRLCRMSENEASVLEVQLSPSCRREPQLSELVFEISSLSGLVVLDLQDRYAPLFDWLHLIDANVLAILLLMSLVAGFNMISGLLIMVFRSIPTIGILKALGMSDRAVASVFIKVGLRTTALGMLIGNGAALLFCLLQSQFKLVRLNPASYFLSYVPVDVDPVMILLCDAAAFAVIALLLLLPSLAIASVDPARSVRGTCS